MCTMKELEVPAQFDFNIFLYRAVHSLSLVNSTGIKCELNAM